MIKTAITERNSFDDFDFVIESFNSSVAIWKSKGITNIVEVFEQGFDGGFH